MSEREMYDEVAAMVGAIAKALDLGEAEAAKAVEDGRCRSNSAATTAASASSGSPWTAAPPASIRRHPARDRGGAGTRRLFLRPLKRTYSTASSKGRRPARSSTSSTQRSSS